MKPDVHPEDPWLDRLRARADEVAPAILVDPADAVRSGRRRRAARRIAVVGGAATVVLALAVGTQPALQLLRGAAADPSVAAGDAGEVHAQPSAAQIEEREKSLALMAERNAITDPPDVSVVRWVERSEWPFVMAECLAEAGFPVDNVSSDGFDHSLRADQETAFVRADYICAAQFPALIPLPPE